MEVITYSLRNNSGASDNYYNDISLFTDKVLLKSRASIQRVVDEYFEYIKKNKIEILRTKEEYLFDLINLGTLLRIYCGQACNLKNFEYFILNHLYNIRTKNKALKPFIDPVRGIFSTIFLTRKNKHETRSNISSVNVDKLLKWMEASGEFREEVKRMILIYAFFTNIPDDNIVNILDEIISFSKWFEDEADKELNIYTRNVDDYLTRKSGKHRWKEDVVFCDRKKSEYYISMLGAEILNRAFKNDFAGTSSKALLLPACMKLLPEGKCKAKKIGLDYSCSGCSPKCRINRLRLDGIEKNYQVHIIPHSSDFTSWLKNWAAGKDIGVIGVACPLNLITGGLELKSLEIPAQCVLLDYCGCKNHWDKNGIATDLNQNQLHKMLDYKNSYLSKTNF